MAQRIVVAGADFTLMRILLLAYVVRLLVRGEYRNFRWNRLDTAIVCWTVAGTVIMCIQLGVANALVNRIGWSFDILVTYFLVRCLIRQVDDVLSLGKIIALVAIPIAVTFAFEYQTQRNPFSIFGGVPQVTLVREGRLRCQGPFSHPILAGTFWASTLPLLWLLWRNDVAARRLAIAGLFAALFIVFACSSSTPLISVLAAAGGIALFRLRAWRTAMWVSFCLLLFALHMVMNMPVWHLMARADFVGGSTGWHRFRIFDAFINNFREWYLTGEPNPMSWGVWEMRDITNQFILEGLRGGLLTLSILLAYPCWSTRLRSSACPTSDR
jgi:hypothetical protein